MASFEPDPGFLAARREAIVILLAWLTCMIWTVGYAHFFGYGAPDGDVAIVLGWPAWVFWGIAVPWGGATLFSVWYGLRGIADDPELDAPE